MHCSIDIETFATTNNPAIVSIGACVFDPEGENGRILKDPFYQTISWQDAQRYGEVSSHTLMWWLTQDPKMVAALNIDGGPLLAALLKFNAWWAIQGPIACIWSHTFDTVALRSAYRRVEASTLVDTDLRPPWHYRDERDIRTLIHLWMRQFKGQRFAKDPQEDKHHALADSIYQAKYIQKVLQDIGGPPNKDGLTPKDIAKQVETVCPHCGMDIGHTDICPNKTELKQSGPIVEGATADG